VAAFINIWALYVSSEHQFIEPDVSPK